MSRTFPVRTRCVTLCGLLVAAAITPLVSAGPVAAAAAAPSLCAPPADTVAPHITSVTFNRHAIDLSSGPRTVTVTAHAVDSSGAGAASGIRFVKMDLYPLQGGGSSQARLSLQSGTIADGVWKGTFRLTSTARAGSWTLNFIWTKDRAGNSQIYDREEAVADSPTDISLHPDWDQTVKVTGTAPLPPAPPTRKPGKPTAFRFTPASVNTTHHAKRVTVTTAFKGPIPRRVEVAVARAHSVSRFRRQVTLVRTTGNHWKGSLGIDRWVGTGPTKTRLYVTYGTHVSPPNNVGYTKAELRHLHLHPVLRTTSGVDLTAPVLTALSFSPSKVDTTSAAQQVTVTASATDNRSGIASVQASIENRDAFATPGNELTVSLHRQAGHWTGHVDFRECVPSGSWQVDVSVLDKARNFAGYGAKRLDAAGFPGILSVTSTPGDLDPPGVNNATASAIQHTITLNFSEGVRNVTTSTLEVFATEPAQSRFQSSLTVTDIVCSNGETVVDCSGANSDITSAELDVPDLADGQQYQVWANVNSVTSQLTDAVGNPLSWSRSAARVAGS